MRFDIITIFPEIIQNHSFKGIIKRANNTINTVDLRKFTDKKYKGVDDRPFGGGDGMVFSPKIVSSALKSIDRLENTVCIHLTPQGIKFNDKLARKLALLDQIIFICGRYAGIDERVVVKNADIELSIGDYILNGGELPCLVVMEATTRFQENVLGNPKSKEYDSFSKDDLLEAPSFTRPRSFGKMHIPEILLHGNHGEIDLWRKHVSILRTFFRTSTKLKEQDLKAAKEFYLKMSDEDKGICGLPLNAHKFGSL